MRQPEEYLSDALIAIDKKVNKKAILLSDDYENLKTNAETFNKISKLQWKANKKAQSIFEIDEKINNLLKELK